MFRKLFTGLGAGLLGSIVSLLLAYLAGVAVILVHTNDVLTSLLAAGTVLPLMLLVVGPIPTLVMAGMIGLGLGLAAIVSGRRVGVVLGALLGVICGELILTGVLPLLLTTGRGDFVDIVRRPVVSGAYGLMLGAVTGLFYRFFNRNYQ